VGSDCDLLEQEDMSPLPDGRMKRSTEETVLASSDSKTAKELLNDLSDSQREVVVMHFYQGMKLEEIARITGSPLGTVKSRLFHGIQILKEALKEVDYAAK
jgi:RNA polymerase sigma-70 factor (ECF subfamily)